MNSQVGRAPPSYLRVLVIAVQPYPIDGMTASRQQMLVDVYMHPLLGGPIRSLSSHLYATSSSFCPSGGQINFGYLQPDSLTQPTHTVSPSPPPDNSSAGASIAIPSTNKEREKKRAATVMVANNLAHDHWPKCKRALPCIFSHHPFILHPPERAWVGAWPEPGLALARGLKPRAGDESPAGPIRRAWREAGVNGEWASRDAADVRTRTSAGIMGSFAAGNA